MDDASLRADCSACAGLCCVALAFDRGPLFAFDKAAGDACRHLGANHRCGIHGRLESAGMGGCVRYDCLGAGQRATALLAGHSWRDSPATARVMFELLRKLRRVHQLILLTRRHSVPSMTPGLTEMLDPPGGWTVAALLTLDVESLAADVRDRLVPPVVLPPP